jgi:hypothetical protein
MDPILDKARAAQNLLERIAHKIPGFQGYREREPRRDADKLQREHLASLLETVKRPLNDLAAAATRSGSLDVINDVETARKRLDKAIARVRYADRGYSGFFDEIKVDETMLERVYQFDLGQSIAAAGLTLALLILPIVIVATRESIRSVPKAIREAAYGLGATRWEVTKDHVLPYSTGGILTGMILGLSRAIGETAPIITIGALSFIAFLPESPIKGEFPFVSFQWLKDPFTAMPIQMFNWVSRPDQAFQANAAAAGAILLGMTLIMNGLAIWIRYRFRKKINW